MPLYDYECLSCNHQFEMRQGFTEVGVAQCPVCQSKARRVFHSVPVLFKGSGFYTTDNKRGITSSSSDGKKDEGEKEPPKVKEKSKDKVSSGAEGKASSESASSKGD